MALCRCGSGAYQTDKSYNHFSDSANAIAIAGNIDYRMMPHNQLSWIETSKSLALKICQISVQTHLGISRSILNAFDLPRMTNLSFAFFYLLLLPLIHINPIPNYPVYAIQQRFSGVVGTAKKI